jgi:hypothetical protein
MHVHDAAPSVYCPPHFATMWTVVLDPGSVVFLNLHRQLLLYQAQTNTHVKTTPQMHVMYK